MKANLFSIAVGMILGAVVAARPLFGAECALRVMSFNIRYGTAADGSNAWPKRRDLVTDVLQDERPHIVGVQEALRFQLDEIADAISEFGEVGVGRDDGKKNGEYAAILYDRRRVEVLQDGTFWFSESPGEPGSITWGGHLPRICTWAHVRDTCNGTGFYVYNVHWDHESQQSRMKSAKLLLARIRDRAHADQPVIVTGDFNAGEENPAFKHLIDGDTVRLRDTFRLLHPDVQPAGTFNAFRGVSDGRKIDAVLVSPRWHVSHAAIIRTNYEGRYPSDHCPVTATIELGK